MKSEAPPIAAPEPLAAPAAPPVAPPKKTSGLKRALDAVERGEVKTVGYAAALETRAASLAESRAAGEGLRATVVGADALDFMNSLAPASVDLLLTDPPYSTEIDDIVAQPGASDSCAFLTRLKERTL